MPMVKVVPAHRSDMGLHARKDGARVNLIERSEILSGSAAVTIARQLRASSEALFRANVTGSVIKTTGCPPSA